MPTAFVTGIEGQDGSYLAELLLGKRYKVVGSVRPGAELSNLSGILGSIEMHQRDLDAPESLARLIADVSPDELYHLAAPSFVATQLHEEKSLLETIIVGVQVIMAVVAAHAPSCRVFLAGSSEMFGTVSTAPQDETTPMRPRAMYGVAKACAHQVLDYYRREHSLFACTGFLYNHESARRGDRFVTRKITRAAARISCGQQTELRLGDLNAGRDWGYAPDYVQAMWAMLQNDIAEDFVVATGQLHTVGEFADLAFARLGLDSRDYVVVDPTFVRPPEPVPLIGDASRIGHRLGWRPTRSFADIVNEMVERDLTLVHGTTKQE